MDARNLKDDIRKKTSTIFGVPQHKFATAHVKNPRYGCRELHDWGEWLRQPPGTPSGLTCPTCMKLWSDINETAFAHAYEMAELMLKEAILRWEIKSIGGVCMKRELAKVEPTERKLVKAEPADDGGEHEPLDQV